MEERDEQQEDDLAEDSVEIPVEVEEGEETLGPDEPTDVHVEPVEDESEETVGAEDSEPAEETSETEGEPAEGGEPAGAKSNDEGADDGSEKVAADQTMETVKSEEPTAEHFRARIGELQERVSELERQRDQLVEERDEFEEERDEFQERMLRAAADLDNYRKRAEREKDELRKYGAKNLVDDLLQTIDNLERALEHAESSDESNIIEGVEMVLRQIHSTLNKHGIEQFDSEGEQFDPEHHEAIQQVETDDHESGEIIEEFQKGYTIHDRLLRPAMVSVAQKVESESGEEASEASEPEPETANSESAEAEESEGDGTPEPQEQQKEADGGDEADDGGSEQPDAG